MITHRRFHQSKHAVSAVIGVIIMVAITIAMAAVAYAYFTGMMADKNRNTSHFLHAICVRKNNPVSPQLMLMKFGTILT